MTQPSSVEIVQALIIFCLAAFYALLVIPEPQFDVRMPADSKFKMKSSQVETPWIIPPPQIFGVEFKSALKIHRTSSQQRGKFSVSPDLIDKLRDVGNYCVENGKHEEALDIFKDVYSFQSDLFGPDDPETLVSLDNLANLNFMLKRFDTSLSLFWRVYKIQEKVHGKSHPDTLFTLRKLAHIYQKWGNYPKAAGFYKVIYKEKKILLGSEHVETVEFLHLLANALWNEQQSKTQSQSPESIEKVLKYYKKVYKVYSKHFGENNDRTLSVLSQIGKCLVSSKRHEEAVSLLQKSVQAPEERQEPDVATENLLAFLLMQLGRLEEARTVFERIAQRKAKTEKSEQEEEEIDIDEIRFEDQIGTALNLAKAAIAQENTANGTFKALEALEQLEKLKVDYIIENDHPKAREFLQSLMKIHTLLGNETKAFEISLEIFHVTRNRTKSEFEFECELSDYNESQNQNVKLALAWKTVFSHFLILLKKHPHLDPEEKILLPKFFTVSNLVELDFGLVFIKSLGRENRGVEIEPEILRALITASVVNDQQEIASTVAAKLIQSLEEKREQEPKLSEQELERIDKEIQMFRKMAL